MNRQSLAINDANNDIRESRLDKKLPYDTVTGLTGALIVAASVDRLTAAVLSLHEAAFPRNPPDPVLRKFLDKV